MKSCFENRKGDATVLERLQEWGALLQGRVCSGFVSGQRTIRERSSAHRTQGPDLGHRQPAEGALLASPVSLGDASHGGLRRLDCVLAPTKAAVLQKHAELEAQQTPKTTWDRLLGKAADPGRRHPLYNTSPYTFARLLGDVERHWSGPVRVLGGAGTGKTVVAMHRARWLAAGLIADGKAGRVLFTTFTRNLATDIRNNLTKICSSEELQRIEVVNLDRWVMNFLKTQGLQVRVFNRESKDAAWSLAMDMADTSLGLNEHFYREEWKDVVLANGCRSRDDYLKARRVGRGTGLNRERRAKIWPVFDALRAEFRQQGLWEPEEAKQAAADLLKDSSCSPRFASVVVDEAQDLDVASFELIRALAGEPHANDLFIVGDPHQRIYGKPVVLGRCGIEIRGRSRKLRINYRTTEETRVWATAVLNGLDFDDLDGGADPASDYRSLLHGDEPLIQQCEDPDEEERLLVALLHQIKGEQGSLASTCITARTSLVIDRLGQLLQAKGIQSRVIEADEADNPSDPSVRLATMHRVKGLEFDQVLIPGLDSDQMPLKNQLSHRPDQVSRELFEQQERSLLHVAATRAKKRVVLSYSNCPSPLIQPFSV